MKHLFWRWQRSGSGRRRRIVVLRWGERFVSKPGGLGCHHRQLLSIVRVLDAEFTDGIVERPKPRIQLRPRLTPLRQGELSNAARNRRADIGPKIGIAVRSWRESRAAAGADHITGVGCVSGLGASCLVRWEGGVAASVWANLPAHPLPSLSLMDSPVRPASCAVAAAGAWGETTLMLLSGLCNSSASSTEHSPSSLREI